MLFYFRFILLNSAKKRMKTDGLNSLKYTVNKIEFRPLYTWINVTIDEKEIMKVIIIIIRFLSCRWTCSLIGLFVCCGVFCCFLSEM